MGRLAVEGRRAATAVVAVVLVLAPRATHAIPVFARVYDKPCSACHTVYPQLNPEGERFRDRGLHGFTPAIAPIRVAPGLDVPGTLPLALSASVGDEIGKTDVPGRDDETREQINTFLGVLAGGELGPHLAFLVDYALLYTDGRTGKTEAGTRPGMAMVQAHAALGSWLTNLRAGAFELPLGASPRVHRLFARGYSIYGTSAFSLLGVRPPVDGRRKDTLSLASTQIGGELSALDDSTGATAALGVVAGSNNRKDNNSSKDVYLRLGRRFGFHNAGFFAYYSPDILGHGAHDGAARFGPDLTLYTRRFRLVAQALAGHDASPTAHGEPLWHWGGFLEGNLRLTPALIALLRVDHVGTPTFDDRAAGGTTRVRRRIWEVTGGAQYLLAENLKVVVEASYGNNYEAVARSTVESWSVTVRLATAFWPLTPPDLLPWLERWRGE